MLPVQTPRPSRARAPPPRYNKGPSMVARGEWAPRDDKALVRYLINGGAREEHEVDWGAAVPGRSEAQVSLVGGRVPALRFFAACQAAGRLQQAPSSRGPRTHTPACRRSSAGG